MSDNYDNGYISDYLIHWTGREGDEKGAYVLNLISCTLRLLLSYNTLHVFDFAHTVDEKMTCFTDVPLRHSHDHCKRYGRFEVAFQKQRIMNKGAQPVFYASHSCKEDMDSIFKYLQAQVKEPTLPKEILWALHRHFYFMQRFSDGQADKRDTYYYEREWRLGEQSLLSDSQLARSNPKYQAKKEGYPPYTGRRFIEGEATYFAFDPEDVAFLIAPREYWSNIENPHSFSIEAYEDLAEKG